MTQGKHAISQNWYALYIEFESIHLLYACNPLIAMTFLGYYRYYGHGVATGAVNEKLPRAIVGDRANRQMAKIGGILFHLFSKRKGDGVQIRKVNYYSIV